MDGWKAEWRQLTQYCEHRNMEGTVPLPRAVAVIQSVIFIIYFPYLGLLWAM